MIQNFKHKGLQQFYDSGTTKGVRVDHSDKLSLILTGLDAAESVYDMNAPVFGLHELKGDEKGTWAVTVKKNWRVTFTFENGHAYVVDYRDYH